AHAFAQYVYATGDVDFLRERAWPVLEGVARWILSRVVKTRRGYEIKATLGFAEDRSTPVDNDAYVNMAAAVVLREAAEAADRLDGFAARIGDRALSARLFRVGFAEFINRPWWDANEFSVVRHPDKPVVGPFIANLGGFLGSCLFGVTGIQPGPDEPAAWPRR